MNVTTEGWAGGFVKVSLSLRIGNAQVKREFHAGTQDHVQQTLEQILELETACAIDNLPCCARCFEYEKTLPATAAYYRTPSEADIVIAKGWNGIALTHHELTPQNGDKHRISANLSGDIVITGAASITGLYLYEFRGLGEPLQHQLRHPQTR